MAKYKKLFLFPSHLQTITVKIVFAVNTTKFSIHFFEDGTRKKTPCEILPPLPQLVRSHSEVVFWLLYIDEIVLCLKCLKKNCKNCRQNAVARNPEGFFRTYLTPMWLASLLLFAQRKVAQVPTATVYTYIRTVSS